jgi:peptidyl-prolyl cis-trans isomerase C
MRKMLATLSLAVVATLGYAAADTDVIVSQGGTNVTLGDIAAYMQHMPEDRWAGFLDSPKRINQMVIGILRNKQLAVQATDLKLDQDPTIKAEIEYSRQEILARKRVEAFDKTVNVPSMTLAAKEEYTAHKSQYVKPGNIAVQHVLISATGRSDAEAKALAEKVYAEAHAAGANFDQLVDKYSDDPSKGNNQGIIQGATSADLAPEFVAGVKQLKQVGEISQPVRTKFGYHVLKLLENVPAKQIDFATVQKQIENKLRDNYIADQRKAFLAKLDEGAPTVNPEFMEILHQRFVPAGTVTPSEAARGNSQ